MRVVLLNVSRLVERKALEQSWASSAFTPAGHPVRRTDPRLDTRLDDLAQLYVRTARNREMRNAIEGVLTQFYEGSTYTNNALVCSMPVRSNDMAKNLQVGDASPLAFPSVIAQGLQDPFYEWCRRLPLSYVSPEVMDFDEGHRFPHSREANTALATAFKEQLATRSSAIATGTATPPSARL